MDIRDSSLFAESWSVAYRKASAGSILNDYQTPFLLIPNTMRYWAADPIVFEHNEKTYIFAELYDYSKYRGIIGVSEYDGKKFSRWKPVLVETTHLSYPFVFRRGNEVYMMPENRDKGSLILYRAVDFPYTWEYCKTIKDGVRWVDTTLVEVNDGYVGFTESISETIKDYVIYLDSNLELMGWRNIENLGNGCYRCGGPMFMYQGMLVRITQDCQKNYGEALFVRYCDPVSLDEKKLFALFRNSFVLTDEFFCRGCTRTVHLLILRLLILKLAEFLRLICSTEYSVNCAGC